MVASRLAQLHYGPLEWREHEDLDNPIDFVGPICQGCAKSYEE